MVYRKIGLVLLVFFMAAALFLLSGLDKEEMLVLETGYNSTYFMKYSNRGLFILTVGHSESMLNTHLLSITRENPELLGSLKSKQEEYAVILLKEGIRLYNADGKASATYFPGEKGSRIISCSISDIDVDTEEELLLVVGGGNEFYGNKLVILNYDKEFRTKYERTFSELNPWKVQTCDVNGDGRREIALGTYKKTAFHPVMAKRPFLYNWDKKDIAPLWRGSRLSRPFDDYIYTDLDADGKDEIVAIERLSDGKALINAYRWEGFGFESIAESMPYEDISELFRQYGDRESLVIKVRIGNKYTWIELGEEKGQFVEKAEFDKVVRIKK